MFYIMVSLLAQCAFFETTHTKTLRCFVFHPTVCFVFVVFCDERSQYEICQMGLLKCTSFCKHSCTFHIKMHRQRACSLVIRNACYNRVKSIELTARGLVEISHPYFARLPSGCSVFTYRRFCLRTPRWASLKVGLECSLGGL